jgi:hypothetical protein
MFFSERDRHAVRMPCVLSVTTVTVNNIVLEILFSIYGMSNFGRKECGNHNSEGHFHHRSWNIQTHVVPVHAHVPICTCSYVERNAPAHSYCWPEPRLATS